VRTVGPGTATITATDPATGISTSTTGDDATVTVLPGLLHRITITPVTALLAVGATTEFTATGHYPNGDTINVTQQVVWSTNAPLAVADNPPGHHSLVRGVAPGTASVSGTHPQGVGSADSGDDASVRVKATDAITMTPASPRAAVGETIRFTVVARLFDDTTTNVTQDATYWIQSGNAQASNAPGDRSAVQVLGAGPAVVRAEFGGWNASATITVTER
jgi:hypothetical protein